MREKRRSIVAQPLVPTSPINNNGSVLPTNSDIIVTNQTDFNRANSFGGEDVQEDDMVDSDYDSAEPVSSLQATGLSG